MKRLIVFLFVALCPHSFNVRAQQTSDLKLASSWFEELDSLCRLDAGHLWGINLYGPTMFIFPGSRMVLANEADTKGLLTGKKGLYRGLLPEDINIANTSFTWNGKAWTMVNWDAIDKEDPYSRAKLLIHESFHRVEEQLGIHPVMTANTHLDQLQGAVLLKLELMALESALSSSSPEKEKENLGNALLIRKYRQALFPGNNEDLFELHEGLPEYTGYVLSGLDPQVLPLLMIKQLELAMEKEGLANSFAYLTGPAYGILFDMSGFSWIPEIKNGLTFPETGEILYGKKVPSDTSLLSSRVKELFSLYDAEEMIRQENERYEEQALLTGLYENIFLSGPVLVLANNGIQMSFNPQEKLIAVGDGVACKTMRLSGEWGIMDVRNGIWRSNDWMQFRVVAPVNGTGGTLEEDGYLLQLNEGWRVKKIKDGIFVLSKEGI